MAYQYAGHYVEALLKNTNASARLLAGIPVVIRLTDGVTLATVYEGRSKAATISNPVITDASGNLSAWLDPGSYLGFPVIEGVEQAAFPMFVGIDPVEADTPPASEVVVTPAGGITATNVQAALVELDTEKATVAALDAEAAARAAADALLVPLTQKGAADGVATLGGDGKLTAGQLPDLAISAFLGTTASEAAMLALVGQRGDWTVRTDTDPDTTWMLTADDPTLLANWRQLSTVTDAVASVNGRTGAVVGLAEAADLTAEANARALADAAEATARTVADGLKAPLASPTFTGVPSMPVVEVTGKNGLSTRRFSGRKTTTGAPTTGTWAVDDEVLDSNGTLWRCTVAGTPGTWVQSSGTIVTPKQVTIMAANPKSTVGTWSNILANSSMPWYAGIENITQAQNDEMTLQVALDAGTWTMAMLYAKNADTGIATFSLSGTALTALGGSATTIDGYAAAVAATKTDITGIVVPSPTAYDLRVLIATKNASATQYRMRISGFIFTRTA